MPLPLDEDEERLAAYAGELADAIEAALAGWVQRSVERVLDSHRLSLDAQLRQRMIATGEEARTAVGPEVRRLLETDVEQQWTNPLDLIRRAVRYPTAVLRHAGVPPVARDEFAERAFREDVYDVGPASFADIDPLLHEPGIRWGAAKAHVILQRRQQA